MVELPLNGWLFSQVALMTACATTLAAGNLMARLERDAFLSSPAYPTRIGFSGSHRKSAVQRSVVNLWKSGHHRPAAGAGGRQPKNLISPAPFLL
jgi:hypothetical protein